MKSIGFVKVAKKALVVLVALIVVAICVALGGKSKWPTDVHNPSIEEVSDKEDRSIGKKIEFEERASYEDVYKRAYRVFADGKEIGSLFFSGLTEDVGLYIDNEIDDSKACFEQIAIGVIRSCDPAISLEDAKSLLSEALASGEEMRDGVGFRGYNLSYRYVLRVDLPENAKEFEDVDK